MVVLLLTVLLSGIIPYMHALSLTIPHAHPRYFTLPETKARAAGRCQLGRYNRCGVTVPSALSARDTSNDGTGEILSPSYYRSVYTTTTTTDTADTADTAAQTPWDIGRAQPTIVQAYADGKFRGAVLDAGCGYGENCLFLAGKRRIDSVTGFDLAEGAVRVARERAEAAKERGDKGGHGSTPRFLVRSCTELLSPDGGAGMVVDDDGEDGGGERTVFDTAIDSGLLHCLSDADQFEYVSQLAGVVRPGTGRAYVGCFSTANPDPWSNPRRLSEGDLRRLFCKELGWEVLEVKDAWWGRPAARGSGQGAFCMALWMEARRI